jgi:hypothetical protein
MEKTGKKRTDMMSAASFLLPLIGAFVSCLVLDLIIIAFSTNT